MFSWIASPNAQTQTIPSWDPTTNNFPIFLYFELPSEEKENELIEKRELISVAICPVAISYKRQQLFFRPFGAGEIAVPENSYSFFKEEDETEINR